ncbi:hypothetical protein BC829DRAFT_398671 [Chytridium lagenaria]|nr:hypothetical protein BC829DRAFT_398671 [Chytridium lagenaria]
MIAAAQQAQERQTEETASTTDERDHPPRSGISSRNSIATPPRSPEPSSIRGRAFERSSTSLRSSADRIMSPSPISAPAPVQPQMDPATNPILDELLHAIKLLSENDPGLTVLDLKDCAVFTIQHGTALASALASNTYLKELNLSNTRTQTITGVDIAEALKTNESLEVLNLENNQIGPQGIKALAESLEKNKKLLELRLANQNHPLNESLIKLGILFRDPASRNSTDRAITRNKEIARKARLAAK